MSYKLQCGQGMEGVANHPFLAREITYCRPPVSNIGPVHGPSNRATRGPIEDRHRIKAQEISLLGQIKEGSRTFIKHVVGCR